jgi:hypothetical protein
LLPKFNIFIHAIHEAILKRKVHILKDKENTSALCNPLMAASNSAIGAGVVRVIILNASCPTNLALWTIAASLGEPRPKRATFLTQYE